MQQCFAETTYPTQATYISDPDSNKINWMFGKHPESLSTDFLHSVLISYVLTHVGIFLCEFKYLKSYNSAALMESVQSGFVHGVSVKDVLQFPIINWRLLKLDISMTKNF